MDVLSSILQEKVAASSTDEKIIWFVRLMKWLQRPRDGEEKKETAYTTRIKYILLLLGKNPEWKQNLVNSVRDILDQISSVSQYSDAGFSNSTFLQEMFFRLEEEILPKQPLAEDLAGLVYESFPDEDEKIYIESIDPVILNEFIALFDNETALHLKLKKDILSATYVISVQMLNAVFQIQKELHYFKKRPEELSEFRLEGLLKAQLVQQNYVVPPEIFDYLDSSERSMEELYLSIETQGVNIDLVYLFQVQKRKLRRLRVLLNFLSPIRPLAVNLKTYISHLIQDAIHQKSFRSFIAENLSLLTKRIVQANSHIGEHYVTFTWSEFRNMFKSASGGGAVTALTVYLKLLLSKLELTGFIKGFADSLNYSSSFLLIQVMGWTLATKQPSATAPFIAVALKKSTGDARKAMVAMLRTQFIAVLGNLSLVFPLCFGVSWFFLELDTPIMTVQQATSTFQSSNAIGPSVIFAAFTGCLLFISSLMAGWFENWVLVKQLPNRLNHNGFLKWLLTPERSKRFSAFVEENSNALAANISLGFLLGMVPQINTFFNLSLDVKHVTLSTGAFASSLPIILSQGFPVWGFLNSIFGIVLIGILNISVSFALAFLLASVSSQIKFSSLLKLLGSCLRMILIKPWLLIVPEKQDHL